MIKTIYPHHLLEFHFWVNLHSPGASTRSPARAYISCWLKGEAHSLIHLGEQVEASSERRSGCHDLRSRLGQDRLAGPTGDRSRPRDLPRVSCTRPNQLGIAPLKLAIKASPVSIVLHDHELGMYHFPSGFQKTKLILPCTCQQLHGKASSEAPQPLAALDEHCASNCIYSGQPSSSDVNGTCHPVLLAEDRWVSERV